MLISNLFVNHKNPQPRFAPGLFIFLLAIFVIMGQFKPVMALAAIGTTLVVGAILVELNRKRIWDDYRKSYRKLAGLSGWWTKPNPIYYTLNVMFLWPFILLLGVICLWAAYALS
jgi:1,4-dihydroxy-2-naphthoate octaprenyltransferase